MSESVSAKPGINSPGTVRVEPYTIFAEEHPKSSLGAVLIPRSTQGSSRTQLGPVRRARKADSQGRLQVAMKPFYQAVRLRVVGCCMVKLCT